MVTIQKLEVRFDVEGDSEEQMFVEMFNKYIDEWSQRQAAQRQIRHAMQRNRQLGDRPGEEGGP
jgi:hypothetical protein